MQFNSERIQNSNRVKILYTDENGFVQEFFSDDSNPLLLTSDPPSLDIDAGIDPALWGATAGLGKTLASLVQGFSGSATELLGNWARTSGVLDMRQKYVYVGSKPFELSISGVIYNRNGIDSIRSQIQDVLDFILPSRQFYSHSDETFNAGDDMSLVGTANASAKTANAGLQAAISKNFGTSAESAFNAINSFLDSVDTWVGDVYVLTMPDQMNLINKDATLELHIGDRIWKDLIISGVSVKFPPNFQYSETLKAEPAYVTVDISFRGLRVPVKGRSFTL